MQDYNIQMVDLKGQYLRLKSDIDQAIASVLDQGAFINGSEVKQFADELAIYNGIRHVIPCANGTDALQIAMMAFDFQPGDEVIVPAFTYVATVEVIALLKLKPVFIDVTDGTFELDITQLAAKITARTVAVVPVHLYGQCSNMEQILEFAAAYGLKVIEDTAQAIGSRYTFSSGTVQRAGTMGHIGTTSFFPSKNLGCYGDGGAVFTNDSDLAKKIQMIANHGQREKYIHDAVGINSRLDTLQAAILRVKLRHLDEFSEARNKVAKRYDQAFDDHNQISIPDRVPFSDHVFHQYTLRIHGGSRDGLKIYLQDSGIPSMIYYPIPVHLQQAYTVYGYKKGDFPVAEKLCREVISLPIHTEMTDEEQDYIVEKIITYFQK